MALSDYLTPSRVVFLRSLTKIDAFDELAACLADETPDLQKTDILNEVWKREMFLPTRISTSIAMPHAIIHEIPHSLIAIGISREGILYEDSKDDLPISIFVMLIGSDSEHLPVLSEVSSKLSNKELCEDILNASSPAEVFSLLTEPYAPRASAGTHELKSDAHIILRNAIKLAAEMAATKIVLHADALAETEYVSELDAQEIIIVTNDRSRFGVPAFGRHTVAEIPFNGTNRWAQVEITLLFLLSQGTLAKGDRVVSVFGFPHSECLDSLFFTDIDKEFKLYFSVEREARPADLKQPVLIRVLQIANELAVEGREGKPIGTLFVLGDFENVRRYSKQLIINPFHGYRDDERNVLDPSLDDTIKEYSRIDGAFVIRGDGVIMSAGTYIKADSPLAKFQAGLGARHAAAASITSMTRSIAVTVSESTQKISLYRSGERFLHF